MIYFILMNEGAQHLLLLYPCVVWSPCWGLSLSQGAGQTSSLQHSLSLNTAPKLSVLWTLPEHAGPQCCSSAASDTRVTPRKWPTWSLSTLGLISSLLTQVDICCHQLTLCALHSFFYLSFIVVYLLYSTSRLWGFTLKFPLPYLKYKLLMKFLNIKGVQIR